MNIIKSIPDIILNDESLNYIGDIKKKNVAIVTDNFVKTLPFFVQINEILRNNKNDLLVFEDVSPDPSIENIVEGIKVFAEKDIDIFIAVGGGSVIDAAKGMIYFGEKISEKLTREKIKFIAVPSTSGTGSEVTNFSVITDTKKQIKYPLIDNKILPDVAILNTSLVMGIPAEITANTGIDVLTHAIEAYVSTNATYFSDALAEKAIKLVFNYLYRAYENGHSDKEARECLHIASTMAGLSFNMASLGINHSLAHAIGGQLHLNHGRTNGVLLKNVILYNSGILDDLKTAQTDKAMERYCDIARMIGIKIKNPKFATIQLVQKINRLLQQLDMPVTFRDFDIDEGKYKKLIDVITEAAMNDKCSKTNPRIPDKKGLNMLLNDLY